MKAKVLMMLSLSFAATLVAMLALSIVPAESATVTASAPVRIDAVRSSSTPTVTPRSSQVVGPIVGEAVIPGSLDGDLRDLPQLLSAPESLKRPWFGEIPNRDTVRPIDNRPEASAFDPVAQRAAGSGDMPAPNVTFNGLNNQDNFTVYGGRVNPPDTNGAVGPNHYVQAVNLVWGVFDKSGNKLFGPARMSTIFAAGPTGTPCDTTNSGDPIVLYDSGADRWIMSQFAFTSTANLAPKYECVAVSKGPNPITSGWWTYAIPAPGNQFNDYPKLSVWPDAYYYTARMFPGSQPFFLSVYALERSAMLAGRPARTVRFDLPGIYDSPLATNWRGEAPPAGTPALIALADEVTNSIVTWQFRVNWDDPASSTLSPEYPVAVATFDEACPGTRDCIPFIGSTSTTMLDDLSPRLMFNLEYRRVGGTESVWTNHTITESGRTAVRWYELRYTRLGNVITPTIFQQGTYAPADGVWRWMGSLAADRVNNMAIGWSASSPSIDPQIRYAGRLAADSTGVLSQGEYTMTVGTGHPTNANSRWGDYSAMSIDPIDDCTFWYTQEYYTTTLGIPGDDRPWNTRIGSFKYPGCTPLAATGTITGLVYNAATLAPIARIPVEAFDAAQNRLYAGATNASGVYTLTVLPGTYAVSGGPLAAIGYPIKGTINGVVVTSNNTSTVNIPLHGVPILVASARTYDDSAAGNGNGYLEPGETQISMTIVLSNTGAVTATSVLATLNALTPGFTLTVNSSAYPDIAANGSGTNSTPFKFAIAPTLTCGAALDFGMIMMATEGTFTDSFRLLTGLPAVVSTTLLYDNVEAGAGGWVTSTNIPGTGFAITTEDSHSPTHAWTDSPGAFYPNGLDTSLTSPAFDFTAFDAVQVKFWHIYSTEQGFDYGQVQYSIDGGATWLTAAAYDDLQDTWTQATVDLSGAAHQKNVRVRFRFIADAGVIDDGWHIDDIQISGRPRACALIYLPIIFR
jgi:hypothetical protein